MIALAAGAVATVGAGTVLLASVLTGGGEAAAAATGGGCRATAAAPAAPAAGFTAEQTRNASTIIAVGGAAQVPPEGWVVALAAALQESGLRALPYGDRDSVGLFQQRTAWGPLADRMDPATSARMFFLGGQGGQRGLLDVPAWQSLTVAEAAQAVQVSAFPGAYADDEPAARSLVATLAPGAAVPPTPGAACEPPLDGGGFHDGSTMPNPNTRTVAQAIAWAQAAVDGPAVWYRRCAAFVANAYGTNYGVNYAIDGWRQMPAQYRHPGDRTPPPGAVLYWDTGSRAGHVALYLGGGRIASNDIVTNGRISVVPADEIESKWHATYLGWSPPIFRR